MGETVHVPGIKQPLPKWAVGGGLAVTGLAIAIYYRNRKNQAAAPAGPGATGLASGGLAGAGTQGDPYPWDGTYSNPSDPYSMDTATGVTYGDEGFSGNFPGGGGSGGVTGTAGGPPFSSNAAWSAYAIQQLTQVSGEAPGPVTEALGLYLNGQELTAAQEDIVYAALAVAGQVPVSGPGGYPPKLRAKASQGNGHKGGKTFAVNPVKGLHATQPGSGGAPGKTLPANVEITWEKSEHATGYQVSLENVTAHRTAHSPVTIVKTSYVFRGLRAGDTFRATVLAKPAEKGAKAAQAEIRTRK